MAVHERLLLQRGAPVAVVCAAAFVVGVVCGARHSDPEEALAARYTSAWERRDYAAMYNELDPASQRRTSILAFARTHREALAIATATTVDAGSPRRDADHVLVVPVTVRTRIFGTVRAGLRLRLTGEGKGAHIAWTPELAFPGLRAGERLQRHTRLPDRAALFARDRTVLARGPDRASPIPDVAAEVTGRLGAIPLERRARLQALGFPADAQVGQSGLERAFDEQLAGTPGGELLAGKRLLSSAAPRPGHSVRTTISPAIERAVVAALAGRLGGIVALRPQSGEILGFAGIAFSGLQPPGSTFKIVTLTGVLQNKLAGPSSVFDYGTSTTLSGVKLENANGESCGGTLAQAFAISCNSVFAPLGAKLGARRLVAIAERFGFNRAPDIAGAATSSLPPAAEIGDDLAVGSSAIGQGRVQATALQMATVAATIGLHGQRPRLTLDLATARRRASTTQVTSERVARTVEKLMLGVVRSGTGTAAAIPGVKVAGKTGTAELETTQRCEPDPERPEDPEACAQQPSDDPTDTDAWFAACAPAGRGKPKICVGVMLVRAGAGGDTAAPAARQVLLAELKR